MNYLECLRDTATLKGREYTTILPRGPFDPRYLRQKFFGTACCSAGQKV